ncbi:MAG TPA: copper amine oxidase N-terminal domain-containing protein [Candidatus Baltobacteraceae bacterium]|nr:copper amine oxidase N-terminal domain-containing protein [Candidatus Baltobacteraceae bacterium]
MQFFKYAGAFAAAAALATTAAGAANVTVQVNGQVMNFDQPPVMRGNRVFVPMRAIFERLGATVVYANNQINATGRGRSVHLTIGSTAALINGSSYTLDVAPFTIAGRTEVPLRFVANALGAGVQWDPNSQTVYINAGGGSVQNYTPQPSSNASFNLTSVTPARGSTVNTTHPSLHAAFSEAVNRDSLHVSVDGRDVTSDVYANSNGFDVTPNFELVPGSHRVAVTGTTAAGASFSTGWTFSTSAGAAANFINSLSPATASRVGDNFTLSGRTLPGSQVHVVAAGSSSALGGLLQIGTGTFQTDTTADGNGRFSVPITINAVSGGNVTVIVTSKSPSGASIERRVVYTT